MSHESRLYVITGSASGIGRETKQLLESHGHRVIGADIRDADVIADLATPEGRTALVEQVTKLSGGTIDAVLAVAGVDLAGPATVAINYYGAIATLEGLRPLLLRSNAPRAVAVSSITSVHPFNDQLLNALLDGTEAFALEKAAEVPYVYATTKRALSRWIRRNALKAEWAGSNIPLNAIAPGLVKTELLKRLFEDPETRQRINAGTPMPLGGPYEPVAAAELLAWLSSEKNGHMTGQTIFIDGGADVMIRGDAVW
ncbi:SDR family oxidoreductase [Burkholderia lata]|jgi:NAD(P)-dependent dehydrogenase (short-subunit alcohol dehydrogenase family)|uniref:Short-chain dehydrogenase/reductase SDR n=1 Tax=Burkholderia lata (strain ATCC 17760 / DSM 23089 / LMG 22485 / NCIMB 9086 / R18194 / 383) TaxID=482957 RepID=Q39GC5_BURL3|nr:SDR family oxidoreductase [Burkholderia lata]ABB08491.1 Short-chain dehydrogenase/reductase SDR [Burkholderia lata]